MKLQATIVPFCWSDPEDCRYPESLRKPFRIGKWAYATNGRICVRIPATTEKKATEKIPKANEEFKGFKITRCKEPWPECEGEATKNEGYRIPPQTVGSRKIAGIYWLQVALLGNVLFNPHGKPSDAIQFVCGDLQGLLMPLEQDK